MAEQYLSDEQLRKNQEFRDLARANDEWWKKLDWGREASGVRKRIFQANVEVNAA